MIQLMVVELARVDSLLIQGARRRVLGDPRLVHPDLLPVVNHIEGHLLQFIRQSSALTMWRLRVVQVDGAALPAMFRLKVLLLLLLDFAVLCNRSKLIGRIIVGAKLLRI